MSAVVRKLKINKRFESSPCTWCGDALALGDDGAVCEACESPHHAHCWDEHGGCGLRDCVNAPLPEIAPATGGRVLRADEKVCPHCQKIIYVEADICRHCNQVASTDGLYHGEQTIAPEAKYALFYSIVGLFCCLGLVLGPVAFKSGMNAKKQIAANPRLRGHAMAVTGQVIGALDVVLWLVILAFSPPSFYNALGYWTGYLALPAIIFVLIVVFIRWKLSRS